MNEELLKNAEILASRPYTTQVNLDETTDGELIYLATNPELYGCLAQGANRDEAIANLYDARVDYIYSLLEDDLSVPEPRSSTITTVSVYSSYVFKIAKLKEVSEGEELDSSPSFVEQFRIKGASLPI